MTSAAAAGNGKQASEVSAKDFSSVVMEQFTQNYKSVRVHATQATSCFPSQIQTYFIPHSKGAPPRRRTNDEIAADEAAAASVESAATALLLQGRANFTLEG